MEVLPKHIKLIKTKYPKSDTKILIHKKIINSTID